MRKLRLATLLSLLLAVVLSTSCILDRFKTNRTYPVERKQYELVFENDVINLVSQLSNEYICVLNGCEIRIFDLEGNEKLSRIFEHNITDLYSDYRNTYGIIMISFDNNEVITFTQKNLELIQIYDVTFDENICDISFIEGIGTDIAPLSFVLLDSGELYAYGKNLSNDISKDLGEEIIVEDPVKILDDISLISAGCAVDKDNCVISLSSGNKTGPFSEKITGISCFFQMTN